LLLFSAAELARSRRARGLRLNVPEATALIAHTVVEAARDGARLAEDLKRRVGQFGYPVEVVAERLLDPLDWEAMGLERGTPWSLSHTVLQSGPFRPSNVDSRVPGLVFAGASTVPGSGVPLVLVSGRLAAQRVQEYARETSIVRW
jgi:phytoene desaturase